MALRGPRDWKIIRCFLHRHKYCLRNIFSIVNRLSILYKYHVYIYTSKRMVKPEEEKIVYEKIYFLNLMYDLKKTFEGKHSYLNKKHENEKIRFQKKTAFCVRQGGGKGVYFSDYFLWFEVKKKKNWTFKGNFVHTLLYFLPKNYFIQLINLLKEYTTSGGTGIRFF